MRRSGRRSLLALGDRYRIYIILVVVFAVMSLFAPRFFNVRNFTGSWRTCQTALAGGALKSAPTH